MDIDDSMTAEIDYRSTHRGQAFCESCETWRPEEGAKDGLCATCLAEPEPVAAEGEVC